MDFKEFTNIIFIEKYKYNTITKTDKDKYCQTFNLCMSKHLPKISDLFNNNFENELVVDMWFDLLYNKNKIPKIFFKYFYKK